MHTTSPLHWAWRGALALFALAGLTGVFFRFATAHGGALGLDLTNVRHAHSHLMYFGWATPALFALIAHHLPRLGGRPIPRAGLGIGVTFGLALVSYPPFLLYGYTPARIGTAELPLSVMAAGFNVLTWYAFAALYGRARRGAPSGLPLRLFDLALCFLVLATLGAWGLPVLQFSGSESVALKAALTHVFLDLFSEGWFVLGVLGLAAVEVEREGASAKFSPWTGGARGGGPDRLGSIGATTPSPSWTGGELNSSRLARWGVALAAAGVPFTFALGMPAALVPLLFAVLSRLGGVLVGGGLVLAVVGLWPGLRGLWRLALGLLALKALGQVAVSTVPGAAWTAVPSLRVLYLHLMLLGFVTLGLVAAARAVWGEGTTRGHRLFAAAVLVLLGSLLMLTPVWPAAWGGAWVAELVAWCALPPVLVALRMATARAATPHPVPS